MQRSRIYLMVLLLVAVLGAILALKTMSGGGRGSSDDRDSGVQITMVSSRPDSGSPRDGTGRDESAGGDSASAIPVTLVGADPDAAGAAGAIGDPDAARDAGGTVGEDGTAAALPPMAALGAAEGIHTTMDSSWFPEREAAEWFAPLEQDFQAARPLTPERYKEILGEHHDRIGTVLKRSAEIGDHSSSEEGIAFLEAWNALVDQYKAEAYGP